MKAPMALPSALPGNAPECEIGAFIGLCGQKRIKIYVFDHEDR
jgi:hypothetical protein